MGDRTKIEWADATWNPVTGCQKVSGGCKHCYAEREWARLSANRLSVYHGRAFGDVQCHPSRLDQPARWRRPRVIFVNSMSDLWHPDVPDVFLAKVFDAMWQAPQHTYLILTKRARRMARWAAEFWKEGRSWSNVWLGVSVEDDLSAEQRIPYLLDTPAAVRWISAEPLLGPIDLTHLDAEAAGHPDMFQVNALTGRHTDMGRPCPDVPRLDWVVVGGESGRIGSVRPMDPAWVRGLRDQCRAADVPVLFKQWGSAHGRIGRVLDGEVLDGWPGGRRPC